MATDTNSTGSILIARENDHRCSELVGFLEGLGYAVQRGCDRDEITALCSRIRFDVVLLDDQLPGKNLYDLIAEIKTGQSSMEILAVISQPNTFDFSRAVEAGVSDWISDGCTAGELAARLARIRRDQSVTRSLLHNKREAEKVKMEMEYVLQGLKDMVRGHDGFIPPQRVKLREDFPEIIGNSKEIEKVLNLVLLVARTHATVLITGESGTGKELITRAIHCRSDRAGKPFVPVNCSALSETLLESELFGHEKGAFTGAVSAKRGLIEESEGGTLFLDEISEMPLSFQVKILRVLQYGEFKPVGASQVKIADIRIIAATNRSLEAMIQEGTLREDLYHRINQFQISIPPLRERIEDLPLLSQYFLERYCREHNKPLLGFSSTLVEKMYRYAWPGNVRELESMVAQAVILSIPPLVELKDMPTLVEKLHKNPRKTRLTDMTYAEAKEEFEKRYFQSIMDRTGGNLSAASRLCKLDRKYLREKIRKQRILVFERPDRSSPLGSDPAESGPPVMDLDKSRGPL